MLSRTPGKILIADDEYDVAEVLRLHLEDQGHTTAWAADGEAALEMLAAGGYDLLLLDIRMPKLDGFQVLRRLAEAGSDVAVLIITAHGSENMAVDCMRQGAVDYFSKPFNMDELGQRVRQALANRRTLLEKRVLEREREDFFFMLSHDLKNPLAAAVGSIDITREGRLGPVNDDQQCYLQSAIDSCIEVVTMIDNLLDMRRFDIGRMPLYIAPVTPAEIIEAPSVRYGRAAENEKIALVLDVEAGLPEVEVDSGLMVRVMANLLTNAIKYTHEGGTITISCRRVAAGEGVPARVALPPPLAGSQQLVRLSVRDTGSGMPESELESIFERYVQSKGAGRSVKPGAGLGLAFCRTAVETFNGIIWAESSEGAGSEFVILLPAAPASARRRNR